MKTVKQTGVELKKALTRVTRRTGYLTVSCIVHGARNISYHYHQPQYHPNTVSAARLCPTPLYGLIIYYQLTPTVMFYRRPGYTHGGPEKWHLFGIPISSLLKCVFALFLFTRVLFSFMTSLFVCRR